MKKYLFIIHQDNGCDYTIECGTATFECEAENLTEAYKKVVENYGIDGDYNYQESELEILAYEISNQYNFVDLKNHLKEYTEYLKLKAKFGEE